MKKLIFQELSKFYGKKMVYAILNGTRKPSLEVAIKLYNDSNIDINCWQDIKSYLQENDTTANQNKSTTNTNKDVA